MSSFIWLYVYLAGIVVTALAWPFVCSDDEPPGLVAGMIWPIMLPIVLLGALIASYDCYCAKAREIVERAKAEKREPSDADLLRPVDRVQ